MTLHPSLIELTRGSTYSFTAKVAVNGVDFDLTNYALALNAKWTYSDSTSAIQLTSADGEIVKTSPTAGEFSVTFSPTDTTGLPNGLVKLVYSITATYSTYVYPLLVGEIWVKPNVN